MKRGILALLMLVLVGTLFPAGTALPQYEDNLIPEEPGLPVLMSVGDHYEDNLIPENPGLPEVMDLEGHFGDNLIPENPGLSEVVDSDQEELDRINEEYERKFAKCKAIEDEDKKQQCIEELNTWWLYKIQVLSCESNHADSPSELNKCKLRAWDDYQAQKKWDREKAACRAKYEAGSEERRECMDKAQQNFLYQQNLIECEHKYFDDPAKELECKQKAQESCERMKGEACLL